ncbi:MAG: penicillin-binding transpeptidase domain-containing protein [Micrococcus sp.]|nr:penicillin-binding transpeptidase domain-containing protein [Micrococcus sp.]
MNEAIRRVWITAVAMIMVLALAGSAIQVVFAENLKDDDLNRRQIYLEFGAPRGPILVDGNPIAQSLESESRFDYLREYTSPELYAPLTGMYSLNYGSTGLEDKLNRYLAGTSSAQFMDRAFEIITGTTAQGDQVELTLNGSLQRLASEAIPEGQRGSVVVTDVTTGAILAMYSRPGFDSNAVSSVNLAEARAAMEELDNTPGASAYTNRPTQNLVSPGSTFKLIDVVAMLESGDYAPDDELEVPDTYTLPGTRTQMGNYQAGECNAQDQATLSWILAHSCNTPFAIAAVELGQDRIREVAERFGFNRGFEMPLNVTGSRFPAELDDAALAQSAIGQRDVQATALQMNMVAAGIANGGMVMQPQLVESIRRSDLSVVQEFSPREFGRATSGEVAGQVRDMMVEAVESGGATGARSSQVQIAAKTGTAQIGGSDNVHSWITGFAPAQNPRYAVTIVIENTDVGTGHRLTVDNMKRMMEAVVAQ